MPFFKKNSSQNRPMPSDAVEEAKKQGQKLGLLIVSLPIPDDSKQALLELLPNFSLEQLARLSAILETAYLNQKTANADKEFADVLHKINADYKEEVRAQEDKTQQELDELEKDIEKSTE